AHSGRFILGLPGDGPEGGGPTEALDLAVLAALDQVVADATATLEGADWTAALEGVERFFWAFCDDYLELVKDRAYRPVGDPTGASARAALRAGLDSQLRLLAPYLPYACEEVWSWWRDGSGHRAAWPGPSAAGDARRAAGGGAPPGHRGHPAGQEPGQAAPAHLRRPGRGHRPAGAAGGGAAGGGAPRAPRGA